MKAATIILCALAALALPLAAGAMTAAGTDSGCATAANAAGLPLCEQTPAEASAGMCRIKDGNETVTFVPVSEVLGGDVTQRSLAAGFTPAYARAGAATEAGPNAGTFGLSCAPGAATGKFTDESGSRYDEPQTAYDYEVVG